MTSAEPTLLAPSQQAAVAGEVLAPAVDASAQYEDYFGFHEEHVFTLPDGRQQIFFTSMNEGHKAKFQQKINKDIHLNQQTKDARIKTDPAGERHELILASVTGWSLVRLNTRTQQFEPVSFSGERKGSELDKWLQVANPVIVEKLEEAIRKANPWMVADMTVEQVDEELKRLDDLRKELVERDAKAADFQG